MSQSATSSAASQHYARGEESEPIARWFVVRTKPHAEKRAREALREMGFEVYLPVEVRRCRHARVTRRTERALIPGYLFVELISGPGGEDFTSVNELLRRIGARAADDGSAFLCGAGGDPLPVSVYEVMAFRQAEAAGEFDHTRPKEKVQLEVGTLVKIVGGPFQGYVGRIAKAKPNERWELLVTMFGRETPLTQDEGKLEKMA